MSLPSVYNSLEYESRHALKRYRRQLKKINTLKAPYRALSETQLKAHYQTWLNQIGSFDYHNRKQVQVLFALAREVTYRLTGKFQYDVQILGALAAMERNMIQMSTGSGKTLTLILPAVAFGLMHRGVFVLTVNDYLSKRDWQENKPVYDWFGLSNGYTTNNDPDQVQRRIFEGDIIYCTNSTLGFAYLNSELASDIGQDIKVIHRPLFAAIIDEADEILMDDARNPLIIASSTDVSQKFKTITHDGQVLRVQAIVDQLKTLSTIGCDEENNQQIYLDHRALSEIQTKLKLGRDMFDDPALMHVIYSAANAIFQYRAYTDYVVQPQPDPETGSRVVLIDKATGRLASGRTLSDDLHVFLEMKEGVFTGKSNDSSIQITYQTLFNLFETIAGVSGTLGTSHKEFIDIYQTGVVLIPDRVPNRLKQLTHLYMTQLSLYEDLVDKVRFYVSAHHPVLIGATSDIEADMVSSVLTRAGLEHTLLVSTDQNEDAVIAKAGEPGSVVVTTDIMGRGTDIRVADVSGERGLVVFQIGSRPNSRVERQFAGRAARQGQPGRYHRMLTVSELSEIGVSEAGISELTTLFRKHKALVLHYHCDLMLNGRSEVYGDILKLIDDALIGTESAFSSSRVEDFKSYSMTDLIQTSLLTKMDCYRRVLKLAMTTSEVQPLRDLALKLATASSRKQSAATVQVLQTQIGAMPIMDLQKLVFQFINHLVNGLIPKMRTYSESVIQTTKLAGQVNYNQKPADMMVAMLSDFLAANHEAYFVLKLPKKTAAAATDLASRYA